MVILNTILFILSYLGLILFIHHALGFKIKSSGMMSIFIIGSILFTAAIFKLLVPTSYAIYGFGFIAFSYYFIKKKWRVLIDKDYHSLMMFLLCVLIMSVLVQANLVHYDNFSHWARIVKFLYIEGRLPLEADKIIEFTSYPVGSALPLFYTAYFIKYHEAILLTTQFLVIASSVNAMTLMIRDKKRLLTQSIFYMFVVFSLIISRSVGLNVLLVDYLMPVLGVGAFVTIIYYKDQFKQMTLAMFFSVFYIITLKNSAVFFVIPIVFAYLFFLIRNTKGIIRKLTGIVLTVGSFLSTVMWSAHFSANFTEVSKHGVNIESYQSIFGEKSPETIRAITELFMETTFTIDTLTTRGLLIPMIIVLLLMLGLTYKRNTAKVYRYLFLMILYVVIYYVGILLMFIVSMPTEEALVLAGYDRYAASVAVYITLIAGVMVMYFGDMLHHEPTVSLRDSKSFYSKDAKFAYQLASLVIVFFVYLFFSSERRILELANMAYEESVPYAVLSQTGDRMVKSDDSYLIVSSDDEGQISSCLIQNVAKHYLWSPNIEAHDRYYEFSMEEFADLFKKHDTIVVVENNISFNEMFEETFGYVLKEGVYDTNRISKGSVNKNNRE